MDRTVDFGRAMDMATALGALKVRGARLRGSPDGTEIHQTGKPMLLLTWEAARVFAQQVQEAEA